MTVPTAGSRPQLLEDLIRDCGLPPEQIVIVKTRPEVDLPEALRPSSEYVENLIVAEIPLKGVYDWVFSGWRYLPILVGAIAILWWSRGVRGMGGLARRYGRFFGFYALIAAPVLWSNRFIPGEEQLGPVWTDAIRLKMFLEVPMVALVAYSLWLLPGLIRTRAQQRVTTPTP